MHRTTFAGLSALTLVAAAGLLTAGPLTPPAGPVTSTYKTLSEVEPRIAINAANTPGDASCMFRITQPGSYYLTGPLVSTKATAIDIQAANITLDLRGFTVSSGSGATQHGINCFTDGTAPWKNIVIRDGTVTGAFIQGGVTSDATLTIVERVTVTSVPDCGIAVGQRGSIRDCFIRGCTVGALAGYASTVEGTSISDCNTSGVTGVGAIVARCTITGCNPGVHIQAHGVVESCTLRDNNPGGGSAIQITGSGSRIESNTVSGSWFGIILDTAATDNLIIRNTVRRGGGTGGILMNGQVFGNYPNNHVAQVVVDPASPFAATNPFVNIQY